MKVILGQLYDDRDSVSSACIYLWNCNATLTDFEVVDTCIFHYNTFKTTRGLSWDLFVFYSVTNLCRIVSLWRVRSALNIWAANIQRCAVQLFMCSITAAVSCSRTSRLSIVHCCMVSGQRCQADQLRSTCIWHCVDMTAHQMSLLKQ